MKWNLKNIDSDWAKNKMPSARKPNSKNIHKEKRAGDTIKGDTLTTSSRIG